MPTAPAAPDTAAIRRKIQQQLGIADSQIAGMPYDPQWDLGISNAYGSLGNTLSGIDLGTQRLNQDYETGRARTMDSQGRDVSSLRNNMANQGNLFSGAYVDKGAQLNQGYTEKFGDLSRNRTRGLENYGRQGEAAMSDYQRQLSGYETGYGSSVAAYLQQQAAAKAAAAQAEAQAAAQRRLTQTQTGV